MLNEKNIRGLRLKLRELSASHTVGVEEGGTMFMLQNTGGAYTITLPLIAAAGSGWQCSFMVDGATMGGEVNILDNPSDSAGRIAWIQHSTNDGANDLGAEDVSFLTAATRGTLITVFTDGTFWYAHGKGGVDNSFGTA